MSDNVSVFRSFLLLTYSLTNSLIFFFFLVSFSPGQTFSQRSNPLRPEAHRPLYLTGYGLGNVSPFVTESVFGPVTVSSTVWKNGGSGRIVPGKLPQSLGW